MDVKNKGYLVGPAIRQRESGRFARIDSQKKPYFHNVRVIRANRLKPAIRNFQPPRSAIRKKGVQFGNPEIRKILVSVKFVSAILGPEMAAPILWAPGISAFFLQENSMSIKFLVLGGGILFFLGGWVPILFLWARGFC